LGEQNLAAADVTARILRRQLDRFRIIRESFTQFVQAAICRGAIKIILRIVRFGLDRLGEFFNRLVVLLVLGEFHSLSRVPTGIVFIRRLRGPGCFGGTLFFLGIQKSARKCDKGDGQADDGSDFVSFHVCVPLIRWRR
jgi:hypothetical protein